MKFRASPITKIALATAFLAAGASHAAALPPAIAAQLNANTPVHLLRGKVKALAVKHGDAAAPAGGITGALAPAGDEPDDALS